MTAAIVGIGTALPAHRIDRDASLAWLARAFRSDPSAARLAARVAAGSGIDARWSCVPDFVREGDALLLGAASPATSVRMRAFRDLAPPLAAEACRRALASAGAAPGEITHLVVVTCTGFAAPGPDADLVRLLGLRAGVERTLVGFMGCHAAFNGLRVARQHVESREGGRALLVCVELCSLHFRPDPSPDNVVASALFADGAAAVVVAAEGEALARLGATAAHIEDGTRADMGWEIGDDGFRMTLSSYVPRLVAAPLADFVAPLAGRAASSWCVHPGGRAILDHVQDALSLPPPALASSRAVLRDVGNVSSASVLFVLERELARTCDGDRGVMLGFGPGLTLEGAAFVRGPRRLAPREADVRHGIHA